MANGPHEIAIAQPQRNAAPAAGGVPPQVEVLVEVPRGSFVKRTRGGRITLVSPVPCPFNYGSVPAYRGLDRDDLDALVLGPRLPRGTWTVLPAFAAVGLTDAGAYDDKLICAPAPPTAAELEAVATFFERFARAKRGLNWLRGRNGITRSEGLCSAQDALSRAWRYRTKSFGYDPG